MTGTDARLEPSAVTAALEVAVRAPSIHNTQPWRWRLDPDGLDVLADRERQLRVADPDGHSMLLSCGAALYLTELGLRATGLEIETSCCPIPTRICWLAYGPSVARARRRRPSRWPTPRCAAAATAARSCATGDAAERTSATAGSDALAWVDFPRVRTSASTWRSRSAGPTRSWSATRR